MVRPRIIRHLTDGAAEVSVGSTSILVRADGYINGTRLCASRGRRFSDWLRSDAALEYLETFVAMTDPNSRGDPIYMVVTGSELAKGAWLHPMVAVSLSNWLDLATYVDMLEIVWSRSKEVPELARGTEPAPLDEARLWQEDREFYLTARRQSLFRHVGCSVSSEPGPKTRAVW